MAEFDVIFAAYLETMRWTEEEEIGGAPLSPELLHQSRDDCASFWAQAKCLIDTSSERIRAGRDFWLTRNGHGAGFWDGNWPEHGDELTALAEQFKSVDLFVGDDGLVYGI